IARALAKKPEARYQSARSFADALQRILEGKPPEDPNEVLTQPAPVAAPPAPSARSQQLGTEAEMEFWREVKDSDDPEDIELYVEQFPKGVYVELALRKMAKLRGEAE